MTSYHGDRDHSMFIHDDEDDAKNLHDWDFIDPIKYVCSNNSKIKKDVYRCDGHEDGDKLYPSYHGDPERGHRFWVYPDDQEIENSDWDFHNDDIPCTRYERGDDNDDADEFICQGHHKSYHTSGENCSGKKKCPGHDQPDDEQTFHGDDENRFWVIPVGFTLDDKKTDFRVIPCNNYEELNEQSNGIIGY